MESDSFVLLGEGAILGPYNVSGVQPGTKGEGKTREREMEKRKKMKVYRDWQSGEAGAIRHEIGNKENVLRSDYRAYMYLLFRPGDLPFFSGASLEHTHLRSAFSSDHTLDSRETRASTPKKTRAACGEIPIGKFQCFETSFFSEIE